MVLVLSWGISWVPHVIDWPSKLEKRIPAMFEICKILRARISKEYYFIRDYWRSWQKLLREVKNFWTKGLLYNIYIQNINNNLANAKIQSWKELDLYAFIAIGLICWLKEKSSHQGIQGVAILQHLSLTHILLQHILSLRLKGLEPSSIIMHETLPCMPTFPFHLI